MGFFSNMIKFSYNPNPKKNWSEYVFGGGLPVQAAMSAERKRKEESTNKDIAAARKAAHDAEVASLSQSSLGAVSMRRRKGLYASLFTGTPVLSAPSTGKTLLSQ